MIELEKNASQDDLIDVARRSSITTDSTGIYSTFLRAKPEDITVKSQYVDCGENANWQKQLAGFPVTR